MRNRHWIILGGIFAALAVAAGAFGAHGLKSGVESGRFTLDDVANFDTASRYQMIHAIGLILLGLLPVHALRAKLTSGISFLLGIVLFSGFLYGYVLLHQPNPDFARILVRLVPIGGTFYIIGWISLAVAASKMPKCPHARDKDPTTK